MIGSTCNSHCDPRFACYPTVVKECVKSKLVKTIVITVEFFYDQATVRVFRVTVFNDSFCLLLIPLSADIVTNQGIVVCTGQHH